VDLIDVVVRLEERQRGLTTVRWKEEGDDSVNDVS
jgi:hypothetical protein